MAKPIKYRQPLSKIYPALKKGALEPLLIVS
ncbi:hypothetical protein SAMN05216357_11384 [Porphyromonadaceae bacterium KH3CP3RA]|nr:hypothetical protein SAMN05216357_11384 [Porphyromonadaceae bacterium KH3CP3RA]